MRLLCMLLFVSILLPGCSEHHSPVSDSAATAEEQDGLVSDDLSVGQNLQGSQNPPPFLTDYYDAYNVKIVWGGPLGVPSPNLTPIDWTGRFELSGGGEMALIQTISFEPGQDSIYLTNAVHLIAWASHTAVDFDGIEAIVYLDRRVMSPIRGTVSFTTGPVTFSIVAERLVAFDTLILADNSSGVVVSARQISDQCASGGVEGDWQFSDRANGSFSGNWFGPTATSGGLMQGRFGTTASSEMTLSGFWLDAQGDLLGVLTGTWGYLPLVASNSSPRGYFSARISSSNAVSVGAVAGLFGQNAFSSNLSKTTFTGKWYFGEGCNQNAAADFEM